MKSYSIEYTNGTKRNVESLKAAREILVGQFATVIECDNGFENAGPDRERLLIWDDATKANNDDGSNAVAQIIQDDSGAMTEAEAQEYIESHADDEERAEGLRSHLNA